MKKSIILILGLSLVLTSCTIDWKDENKAKIEKLEKEIQNDTFKKKQECAKYIKNLGWWQEIFYSPKLNSCIKYSKYYFDNFNTTILTDILIDKNIFSCDSNIWNCSSDIETKIKELKWE